MTILIWFLLLVLQNAAFTWVSRARNSGSYLYHGVAAVFSNGLFFVMQFLLISFVVSPAMSRELLMFLGVIYVIGTVTGSVAMHWIAVNYLEKGKRAVGAVAHPKDDGGSPTYKETKIINNVGEISSSETIREYFAKKDAEAEMRIAELDNKMAAMKDRVFEECEINLNKATAKTYGQ